MPARDTIDVHALPGSDAYLKEQERIAAEARGEAETPEEAAAKAELAKAEAEAEAETPEEAAARAETEAKAEEDAKAEADAKGHMIPKSRLDEEIRKRREMEDRMAQLEGRVQGHAESRRRETPAYDFADAQKKKWKAIEDGEWEDARALEDEIADQKEKSFQERMAQRLEQVQSHGARQADAVVASRESVAKYPELDEEGPEYNEEAFKYAQRYIASASLDPNMDAGAAIREGAEFAAIKFGLGDFSGRTKPDAGSGLAKAATVATTAEVRLEQAKAKAETAKKQPAAISTLGTGGDGKAVTLADIVRMTDDDFDKMPKERLAKLRGDFLPTE